MKKAKRILALAIGLMMALGCVSVSASDALTVTETPVKTYFVTDFSENTNIEIVEANTTQVADGALKVTNTNTSGADTKAKIYAKADKSGIAEPVFVEFDVSHNGLFQTSGNDIEMFFVSSTNGFIDFRWLSDRNIQFYQDASNKHLVNLGYVYSRHIKVKIDPLAKKYAMWINGEEIVGEDEYNYIRNSGTFNDFAFLQIKTTGSMSEVALDNFIVYSEPQTAFPMVEELYNEPYDSVGGSKVITATDNDWDLSKIATGEDVAYEIDINSTSGRSAYHGIMFRNQDKGIHTRVEWNSAAGDSLKVRVWDPSFSSYKYIVESGDAAKASTYNANNGKIKVTAVFSQNGKVVEIYANGIFVVKYEFSQEGGTPSVLRFILAGSCQASVDNVRVYKFINELSITEDENTVKIVTPEANTGNLYFAKYDGEGNNKTLAALGIAPLKLVPGKIYTVDKTNWAGARAFFWDDNLTPIVDPLELN